MSLRFIAAVTRLIQADEQLLGGRVTSVQHAALREAALLKALKELAMQSGVELDLSMSKDGKGDISLVAKPEPGQSGKPGPGHFGQAFVDRLNAFLPVTGRRPNAMLLPERGKCQMNHLDAEKMVMACFDELKRQQP